LPKINPFFILIIGAIAIAFSPIFVRFSDVDPIMTAFYRIFISLPFFLFFSSFNIIEKVKFPEFNNSYVIFLVSGIFFALDLICWHWSIKLTTVSKATFLSNLAPIVVIIFSLIFLKERFSKFFYLAALLSMVGMLMLLGESFKFNKSQFIGDLLGVLTAVWYGSYIVTISQLRKKYNSTSIMFLSGIVTAIILLIVSILFEQSLIPQSLFTITIIFLLGFICQFMGQSFITYSLAYLSASLSSLCLLIQPIAATVLAYFFFQEKLTTIQFFGSALILIGIYIARTKYEK
jgi:drug/metabolite transporter (DMT)-like permease|tara:strand:- start:127 stop:996 length:870 start_codon:yes stop_codon:yes gene_type:complete